jgi:hypothetical protein
MSRLMTLGELYSLLLQTDTEVMVVEKQSPHPAPVLLNQHSPAFWVGPRTEDGSIPDAPQPKLARHVRVAGQVMELMGRFAESRGIRPDEAWTEAAHNWIAQRQWDVRDLATPAGRELALAVGRSWDIVDAQLADLRTSGSGY